MTTSHLRSDIAASAEDPRPTTSSAGRSSSAAASGSSHGRVADPDLTERHEAGARQSGTALASESQQGGIRRLVERVRGDEIASATADSRIDELDVEAGRAGRDGAHRGALPGRSGDVSRDRRVEGTDAVCRHGVVSGRDHEGAPALHRRERRDAVEHGVEHPEGARDGQQVVGAVTSGDDVGRGRCPQV